MKFSNLYKEYNGYGFASSCSETPEFKKFAAQFKRGLDTEAKERGMEVIGFLKGHFYVSGFLRRADGKILYFAVPDVRDGNALDKMYYRFAKNEKDFTGGFNHRASLAELMDAIAAARPWHNEPWGETVAG